MKQTKWLVARGKCMIVHRPKMVIDGYPRKYLSHLAGCLPSGYFPCRLRAGEGSLPRRRETARFFSVDHAMIQDGATALRMATFNDHDEVTQLLVNRGASVDAITQVRQPKNYLSKSYLSINRSINRSIHPS